MTSTERKNLRDAMAIIKRACWEVEEGSSERKVLGHVMRYLYYTVN